MMNTKVALKQLMATHFITVDVPCPECGEQWQTNSRYSSKMSSVCMECGYRSVKKKQPLLRTFMNLV